MISTDTTYNYILNDIDFMHEPSSLSESSLLSSPENDTLSSSSNSPIYQELGQMPTVMMHILPSTSFAGSSEPIGPYLSIENDCKHILRFRYKSEKGQHGGLKPIVKLHNYEGIPSEVYIKASLYTTDERCLHVLDLDGKQCKDGICWQKLSSDYTAKFPSLSIYTKKKEEITAILKNRKKTDLKQSRRKIDELSIEKEVKEELKSINLACAKLCFEAFVQKKNLVCEKVFSEPISNQKNPVTGNLKITRLSNYSGKCSGGDELILLCEKIRKEDIEIHICEYDAEGKITWKGTGQFNPADVHHQVAIPFKTPPYKENREATVFIMLYRKSDGKFGEGREFRYIPNDNPDDAPSCKRKRPNSCEDFYNRTSSTNTSNEMLNINSNETSNSSASDPATTQPMLYQHENPSSVLGLELINCWDIDNIFSLPSEKGLDELESILTLIDENPDLNAKANPGLNVKANPGLNVDATISDFASLNLSTESKEKTSILEKGVPKLSNEEQMNKLKECLIYLIRSREKCSFIQYLPILMEVRDENHNTLLHLTIKEKSSDLVMLIRLLQVAPKVLKNEINKFHQTPLHLAISQRLWKCVRILLLFGADPNIRNINGDNCVHLAVKYNLPQCLAEILSPSVSEKYQKCTPCINALNHAGLSALHISVMNESKVCTELLIKAKANINITDGRSGKTPLHLAYEQGSKLVEYLISQPDIDKTAVDFRGSAPNLKEATSCHDDKASRSKGLYTKPECVENVDLEKNISNPNKTTACETTKSAQCCIEISLENNSDEDSSPSISETDKEVTLKVKSIDSEIEQKLCEILDCNGQWKKLGAYIMDNNELDVIAELDSAPTRTILNQLKKRHGEKYSEELLYILRGTELKEVTEMLK